MATAQDDLQLLGMLDAAQIDPAASGFEVHYQPIVRLASRTTIAVEALARWHHPIAGAIDPSVFVPVAERAGMMVALDDFVLERACADAEVLAEILGLPTNVHVNISASRLGQPSLEAAILRAVGELNMDSNRLIIEITETSRIADLTIAAGAIRQLRTRGVRFALDDFGSGFNALVHFHALPVDYIKLGGSMIDIQSDAVRAEALCRSVLMISDHLGAVVVAEGIETQEQAQMLLRLGCEIGQGYLYGRARALHMLSASP